MLYSWLSCRTLFHCSSSFYFIYPQHSKALFFLMFYLFQLSWNKKEMLKKEIKFYLIFSYNYTPFGNQYWEFGSCAYLLHLSTLSSLLYTVLCSQRGLTLCSTSMSILILHLLGWFGQRQIKKRLENNRKEIFISDTLFSNGCVQSHRSIRQHSSAAICISKRPGRKHNPDVK